MGDGSTDGGSANIGKVLGVGCVFSFFFFFFQAEDGIRDRDG